MARAPAIGLAKRALRNQFLTPLTHHGVEGQDRVFTVSDDDGNQGKVRVRRVRGDRCQVLPYGQAQRNPERPVPDYALGEPEILEKATVRSWLPWRIRVKHGSGRVESGSKRVTVKTSTGFWQTRIGEYGSIMAVGHPVVIESDLSVRISARGGGFVQETHVWDVTAYWSGYVSQGSARARRVKPKDKKAGWEGYKSLEEAIRAAEDWFAETAPALWVMKQAAKGKTTKVDVVLRRFPSRVYGGNDTIEVSWSIDEEKAKRNGSFERIHKLPPRQNFEEYIKKVKELDTWIPILTCRGRGYEDTDKGKVAQVFKRYEVDTGAVLYRFYYLEGRKLWILTASPRPDWIASGHPVAQTETLEDMVRFLEGYLPEYHPIWSMQAAAKKSKKKGAKKNPKPEVVQSWLPWETGRGLALGLVYLGEVGRVQDPAYFEIWALEGMYELSVKWLTLAQEQVIGTFSSLEDAIRAAENEVAERDPLWAMRHAAKQEVYNVSYPNNRIGPSVQVTRKAEKNPYRSAVIAMPTSAQLAMLNGPKLYDPREWQINAQALQIYMQSLDGRDSRKLSQSQINKLVSRAFQIATGVEQKAPRPKTVKRGGRKVEVRKSEWVKKGTRTPTARTRKASKERYAGTYVGTDGKQRTLTDLVLGRQWYELMLAMRRKERATTDFYRVVPEVTTCGILYFVWPLPPGADLPGPAQMDYQAAADVAADLNRRANPYKTREWWQSGKNQYTKNELSYWLPPEEAFDANFDAKAFDAKMKRPWGGRRRSTA